MWVMLVQLFVYCLIFLLNNISPVESHVPSYISTPSNKVDQFCQMSDQCVHDTIPICGKMGDQMRTFLDLCDMLEFACDTNNIYVHIEDVDGCPKFLNEEYKR